MKVLVFVAVACLLSGADAAGFVDTLKGITSSIGDVFTNLFKDLQTPLQTVASTLVDSLKTAGTQLLATGAQSKPFCVIKDFFYRVAGSRQHE